MATRIALLVVCWVAIHTSARASTSSVAATGKPGAMTASQILQEFAKTQDRLLSCAYTVTTEDAWSERPGVNRKLYYEADVRTDATRAELRLYRWGDMTLPVGATRGKPPYAPFPREKAEYRHELGTARTNVDYLFWN